jgi:acyl carrier protein
MITFIKKFKDQLLNQNEQNIYSDTLFRELDEWDSLTAMAVIAMIDDEYSVKISDDEFKQLYTIQDLYDFVISCK